MPLTTAPQGFIRGGSVASLFGDNLRELQVGIRNVVRKSFETKGMRSPTEAAVRDRVDFCVTKAAELRRELIWGTERIIDSLPAALAAHLDGRTWEPSKRACWVPEDGT